MKDTFFKMTNFHKLLFFSSLTPLIFFLLYFEIINIFDIGFILYLLSFFFCSVILIFWTYWYAKAENRSTIFIIVGLLIFSMWIRTGIDIYARSLYLSKELELYSYFLISNIWIYRTFFQSIVLLWLLTWIISRVFRGEEYFKDYRSDIENDDYFDYNKDIKPSILAIDDEEEVLNLLEKQIDSFESFEFYKANSLEEGFELFKQRRYYLIILDLKFKNKNISNVIEFCKKVRDEDRFVFIVILTGFFDQAFNYELISYIDDIFSKPYSYTDLKNKLLIWNLKYRRRIFYIKDLSIKVDCVKNTVIKILSDQGKVFPISIDKEGL